MGTPPMARQTSRNWARLGTRARPRLRRLGIARYGPAVGSARALLIISAPDRIGGYRFFRECRG